MRGEAGPILKEMDTLWSAFCNCRAHFPCVGDEAVGQTAIRTAPWYLQQGFDVWLCFPKPLTKKNVSDFNAIGHWLNQNFIVRLCALLEARHVLSDEEKIDQDLQEWERIDIIRRLRNLFAHSSGHYKRQCAKHRKLLEKMNENLRLSLSTESTTEFPLGISDVLNPLFEGCKEYVKAWAQEAPSSTQAGKPGREMVPKG